MTTPPYLRHSFLLKNVLFKGFDAPLMSVKKNLSKKDIIATNSILELFTNLIN